MLYCRMSPCTFNFAVLSNLKLMIFRIHVHQFGCGISKMVGPIKKDFWPRINTLEGKKNLLMEVSPSKIGHDFSNKVAQKLTQEKKCFKQKMVLMFTNDVFFLL